MISLASMVSGFARNLQAFYFGGFTFAQQVENILVG
jgi:hypothetical protein